MDFYDLMLALFALLWFLTGMLTGVLAATRAFGAGRRTAFGGRSSWRR